jgi:hypothetical protein
MRVYLVPQGPKAISKIIADQGVAAIRKTLVRTSPKAPEPRKLRGFADVSDGSTRRAQASHAAYREWQVESLAFPVFFRDYGATAKIDFYVDNHHDAGAVLVFMYTDFDGTQAAEIKEVVDSFGIGKP